MFGASRTLIRRFLSVSLSHPLTHTLTLARKQAARGHGEVIVREVGSGQRARHAISQISQEIKADILVLGIFGRKHESGAHKVIFYFFLLPGVVSRMFRSHLVVCGVRAVCWTCDWFSACVSFQLNYSIHPHLNF